MIRRAIALLGLVTGCGQSVAGTGPSGDGGPADAAFDAAPSACADAGVPAPTLECAGLYSDFASKTVAPTMHPYAPAVPLWSDGAEKQRWIELPAGKKIDATDPNEWVFPVGTKVFKQFSYGGRRVETRLFEKVAPNQWVHATYAWNDTETATRLSYGESVTTPDGGSWLIPSGQDCEACHFGRSDRILGFEAVNLGLPGASGYTLARLVQEGLVTPAPASTSLVVGDDGTGLDGPALSWLHVNCGVTCHNANEGSTAYGAGMRLRLDPRWLDGSPPTSSWDPIRTAVSVPCTSGSFAGQPRIAPGDPSASVLVQLISTRGGLQMPPAPLSRLVDTPDVAAVKAWVAALPGPPDAGGDASPDAGPGDAAMEGGGDATTDAPLDSATESSVDASMDDAAADAASDAISADGGVEEAGDAAAD